MVRENHSGVFPLRHQVEYKSELGTVCLKNYVHFIFIWVWGTVVLGYRTGVMDYYELADQMAERYGLDPAIFRRQIMAESTFNPDAVSDDGALGLGQVLPSTAADPGYGVKPLASDLLTDPEENLRFSAEYMRAMLDESGGDYALALARYNAGPGAVDKAGGIPENEETLNYISKILPDRGGRRTPSPVRPKSRPDTIGGVEAALRKLLEDDGGSEDRDYGHVMSGLASLSKAFGPRPMKSVGSSAQVTRGRGGDALSRFEGLASLRG
jgi:hypothetical protein